MSIVATASSITLAARGETCTPNAINTDAKTSSAAVWPNPQAAPTAEALHAPRRSLAIVATAAT